MSQPPDPGPIEPAFHEQMNALAHTLDEIFNGDPPTPRKVGFFLSVFNLNQAGGRFNYISNADRLDVATMLKDILARVETPPRPAAAPLPGLGGSPWKPRPHAMKTTPAQRDLAQHVTEQIADEGWLIAGRLRRDQG